MSMDYQAIAGKVLFGGEVLDNALRGYFIEAVVFKSLERSTSGGPERKWRHAGRGWGPWDLQRGTHGTGTRVRFQVKVSADKQTFEPQSPRRPQFSLGWRHVERLPTYFKRDFPEATYGACELVGYRCDAFLLAWHGPWLVEPEKTNDRPQSDPESYDYFIVPIDELGSSDKGPKVLPVAEVMRKYPRYGFVELPAAMNQAADKFLDSSRVR